MGIYRHKAQIEAYQVDGTDATSAAIVEKVDRRAVAGKDAHGANVAISGAAKPIASKSDWVVIMGQGAAVYTDEQFQERFEVAS